MKRIGYVLFLLLLTSISSADTITGRLVDENGVGIANGDVDAFNVTDDDFLDLVGDSTDANGFFNITLPGGLYVFTFQGPPGSTLIDQDSEEVTLAGSIDFGTITLEQGYVLSGMVVDQNSFPVPLCDLDVFDLLGTSLDVSGDQTDVFGNFSVLVPGNCRIDFDPRNAIGGPFAPVGLDVSILANTNIGSITLPPGFTITGTIRGPGGVPLQGVDVDFTNSSGAEAVLYGDRTSASGNFAVVVAAETYEITVCPQAGSLIVATELEGFQVPAMTSVGTLELVAGVSLSGTLTDGGGLPVAGADVDVLDANTGASIPLCRDGSNTAGAYSVVVPPGTFDVIYTAPGSLGIQNDALVVGATQLDAVLSPCPSASATFRNGTGINPPVFTNLNPPRIAKSWNCRLDATGYAAQFGVILLNNGAQPGINTSSGQFLLGGQNLLILAAPHGGGVVDFSTPIPANISLCGRLGYAQGLILGAPGPQFTNALDLVVGI